MKERSISSHRAAEGWKEEHSAVEEGMRVLGIGVGGVRNRRWTREGGRVGEKRVSAVLRSPGVGSPGIVVEVADASVVGREVGGRGQSSVEGRVRVAEDGYIGVQEDNGVVTGEAKRHGALSRCPRSGMR